jgi:hypothetical protein
VESRILPRWGDTPGTPGGVLPISSLLPRTFVSLSSPERCASSGVQVRRYVQDFTHGKATRNDTCDSKGVEGVIVNDLQFSHERRLLGQRGDVIKMHCFWIVLAYRPSSS